MAKTTTDRIKFNPPLGRMPTLQFVLPQELQIDDSYQRSIEQADSQKLIRQIAQYWDWDLCQPLMVSRRGDGALYVIDGQHRLAAARLRGDIAQLPAMVKEYASAADEAASFVHLNQRRRPLTGLQIFRAAVASGDREAVEIVEALQAAGLRLSKSSQLVTTPPGSIVHVAGVQQSWRRWGKAVASEALHVLAMAFAGQRLIYAGTIWPGIVAVVADEFLKSGELKPARAAAFSAMLGAREQSAWRADMLRTKADAIGLNAGQAMETVICKLWAEYGTPAPAPAPALDPAPAFRPSSARVVARPVQSGPVRESAFSLEGGKGWCDQCENRRSRDQVYACQSKYCSLKAALAA